MSVCGEGAFLKRMVIFLRESTLIIALAPLAITSATIVLTKNPFSGQLILLPFFAGMMIYSLNRITDSGEDAISTPDRTRFPHRLRMILLGVSFISTVLLLMMVLQKNILTFVIGGIPLVIAFMYSVLRLKRFFVLKNFLIAAASSASVLIVPAYYENWTGIWKLLVPFFFILVLLNAIVFDIKDVKGDSVFGIRTLPLQWGIPATKYFCFFLLAIAGSIFSFLFSLNRESILLIPCICTVAVYTCFAPEGEQSPWWYFGFLVDGEFLVLLLMVLIIRGITYMISSLDSRGNLSRIFPAPPPFPQCPALLYGLGFRSDPGAERVRKAPIHLPEAGLTGVPDRDNRDTRPIRSRYLSYLSLLRDQKKHRTSPEPGDALMQDLLLEN